MTNGRSLVARYFEAFLDFVERAGNYLPHPASLFAIVIAGVLSNMASEIGYVLLVPLAAIIFQSAGRHPLVGLAAAFAGVYLETP